MVAFSFAMGVAGSAEKAELGSSHAPRKARIVTRFSQSKDRHAFLARRYARRYARETTGLDI